MSKYINPIRRGDAFEIWMDLTNDFATVDLTGAEFMFTLKNAITDADVSAVLQHASVAGSNPNDVLNYPTQQIVVIKVPESKTALLTIDQSYFWDIQCTFTGGESITVLPPIEIDAKTGNPILDRNGNVHYDKVYAIGDITRT